DTLFKVSSVKGLLKYSNAVRAVITFLKKAKLLADIQTAEGIFRAYERNQGDTTNVINNLIVKLDEN
ncbi:unnamed protein product, partial [marine sediment metagenome]